MAAALLHWQTRSGVINSDEVGVLVLGTHGRTGVVKLFLGSVAARVVATAPCPVLTVRAQSL